MAFIPFLKIQLVFFSLVICLQFSAVSQLPFCKDSFPASLLLNSSFEQYSGCNHEYSDLEGGYIDVLAPVLVNNWHPFSEYRPVEYFNYNCKSGSTGSIFDSTSYPDNTRSYVKVPWPLPDSIGFIAISETTSEAVDLEKQIPKTYVTACLLQPLYIGQPYVFSFYLGFGKQHLSNFTDNFTSPSPFGIALFGRQDCQSYPSLRDLDSADGCLTNRAGWVQLGKVQLKGNNQWVQGVIEFTPSANISCIGVGPDCSVNPYLTGKSPMYYMDKFVLAPKADFSFKSITAISGSVCTGNFILKAPAYPDANYQWYRNRMAIPNASSQVYVVPNVAEASGDYSANISLPYNACINTLPYTVSFSDINKFNLGNDTTVCAPTEIQLSAAWQNAQKYIWQDGSTNSTFIANKTGNYSVEVTDEYGCIKKDTIKITIQGCDECELYVPSAFTPNNDKINDIFKALPKCTNFGFQHFKLRIYNRWGQAVFTSNTIYKGWDGTYKTHPLDTGTYIYFIDYAFEQNKPLTKKGTVLLLR